MRGEVRFLLFGLLAMTVLSGCSTPRLQSDSQNDGPAPARYTRVKIHEPRTSQRIRVQAVAVAVPCSLADDPLVKGPPDMKVMFTGDRKMVERFETVRGWKEVQVWQFPDILAADGERVTADAQRLIRCPSFSCQKVNGQDSFVVKEEEELRGVGAKWTCLPSLKGDGISLDLDLEVARQHGERTMELHEGRTIRVPFIGSAGYHAHFGTRSGQTVVLSGVALTAKGGTRSGIPTERDHCLFKVTAELAP